MPQNLQNRHTSCRIDTPIFGETMYLCNINSFIDKTAHVRTDPFHRRDTPLAHHHLLRRLRCDVDMVLRAPGAGPAWQVVMLHPCPTSLFIIIRYNNKTSNNNEQNHSHPQHLADSTRPVACHPSVGLTTFARSMRSLGYIRRAP